MRFILLFQQTCSLATFPPAGVCVSPSAEGEGGVDLGDEGVWCPTPLVRCLSPQLLSSEPGVGGALSQ